MLTAGDAMALGCALSWAIAVILFRKLGDVPPAALNLFKNAAASVALWLTMLALRIPWNMQRSWSDWLILAGTGVLGLAIADTLFFAGLRRIDASLAALTDCAYAPTVIVLSTLVLDETLGAGIWIGAPLVVLGLWLATWQPRSHAAVDRRGVALAVLGVMGTAAGAVLAKPRLIGSDLVEATTVRLLAGTLALFVYHLLAGSARAALALFRPQPEWRIALPATLFGTYISMLLWLGGLQVAAASRTALLNPLGAVFVLLFSRFSGERVPRRRWVGAALAIGGAGVVLTR